MPDFNEVVDQTCLASGADFSFVLTRKGRLVTEHAPRDMPAPGRKRLVEAALSRAGAGAITHLEMPRQELVPYGGAAPVDVYVAVASEQAILCVVVPTWAERTRVFPAMEEGLRDLEDLIRTGRRAPPRRAPSRPKLDDIPPAEAAPPPDPEPPPPSAPRRRGALAGLLSLAVGPPAPARSLAHHPVIKDSPPRPAPLGSLPEIRIGEATLGRESLAAIARELAGDRATRPSISVSVSTIGRETLAAIAADASPAARAGSAPEALRVELASISPESVRQIVVAEARQANATPRVSQPIVTTLRMTQPWVESAADAKRAADAAKRARNAPPDMMLGFVEAGQDVLELGLADLLEPDPDED